ncbi:MAG: hypothetical protein GX594_04650 [Pirellulaceae bacterium]|nr:hypothetical protein [Pirellulaceae bacterium]
MLKVLFLCNIEFDYVVMVCDNARQSCPIFRGKVGFVHVGFDDPPRLEASVRTEEERLAAYRQVRDEIKTFVEMLPDFFDSMQE